jgi:hypothetical protein
MWTSTDNNSEHQSDAKIDHSVILTIDDAVWYGSCLSMYPDKVMLLFGGIVTDFLPEYLTLANLLFFRFNSLSLSRIHKQLPYHTASSMVSITEWSILASDLDIPPSFIGYRYQQCKEIRVNISNVTTRCGCSELLSVEVHISVHVEKCSLCVS